MLRTRRAGSAAAGAAGMTGSLACAASMALAGLGLGASTAAVGMAGMNGARNAPNTMLDLLIRVGPGLFIASTVLIALAFALQRLVAAVLALLAGGVLYAGMYAQSQPHRDVSEHRGRLRRMGSRLPVAAQLQPGYGRPGDGTTPCGLTSCDSTWRPRSRRAPAIDDVGDATTVRHAITARTGISRPTDERR
jgi:hypothetical protein